MSISALFGSRVTVPSSSSACRVTKEAVPRGGLTIECSSRPQKKGTAHHMKTRPKKTQHWDIKRRPTVYPSLPPLPPDWTLASEASILPSPDQPLDKED